MSLRGQDLSRVPIVRWLLFAIYLDSFMFIIASMVLTWGLGLNKTLEICATAIYLCLACYMSTKVCSLYHFWKNMANHSIDCTIYLPFNNAGNR
jgi:hypothetical protein